jgi:hypothetical protein
MFHCDRVIAINAESIDQRQVTVLHTDIDDEAALIAQQSASEDDGKLVPHLTHGARASSSPSLVDEESPDLQSRSLSSPKSEAALLPVGSGVAAVLNRRKNGVGRAGHQLPLLQECLRIAKQLVCVCAPPPLLHLTSTPATHCSYELKPMSWSGLIASISA